MELALMMMRTPKLLLAACVVFGAPLARAQAFKRVATDATVTCASPFSLKDGACVADEATIAKLEEKDCKGAGLAFVAQLKKCIVVKDQAPKPLCGQGAIATEWSVELKACVAKDEVPRSSLADYLGDCFEIRGLPAPPPTGLEAGQIYEVSHQRKDGENDKALRLAKADAQWWRIGCKAKVGTTLIDVKGSELIATGAHRAGWTYGVLAIPYKLHTDDRSFSSGVSIGPYVGRRWGKPGSAYTFALAATIGSVKGEVRDSQNNITSTPDLQAFSFAAGWMYDIAKDPEVRPFKLGVFFGTDIVGSDNSVKYKYNKKPWVALQIGFEFTDN